MCVMGGMLFLAPPYMHLEARDAISVTIATNQEALMVENLPWRLIHLSPGEVIYEMNLLQWRLIHLMHL